jgi:hypothetical protein
MRIVFSRVARWRLQTENLLRDWRAPTLAVAVVLGAVAAAVMWAFAADRSPGVAASVMGIAAFGGMFLIAAIGVGIFLARRPQQIIEELLSESARTCRSHWKMALLAEAQRYIATTTIRPQRPESVEAWQDRWRTQHGGVMSTSE